MSRLSNSGAPLITGAGNMVYFSPLLTNAVAQHPCDPFANICNAALGSEAFLMVNCAAALWAQLLLFIISQTFLPRLLFLLWTDNCFFLAACDSPRASVPLETLSVWLSPLTPHYTTHTRINFLRYTPAGILYKHKYLIWQKLLKWCETTVDNGIQLHAYAQPDPGPFAAGSQSSLNVVGNESRIQLSSKSHTRRLLNHHLGLHSRLRVCRAGEYKLSTWHVHFSLTAQALSRKEKGQFMVMYIVKSSPDCWFMTDFKTECGSNVV